MNQVKTIGVSKKTKEMHKIKRIMFFLNMHKMVKISAETYTKTYVYNITDKEKRLWIRNKDIGEKLDVENIYDLIDKEVKSKFERKNPTGEVKIYKIHGSEFINGEKFMYIHEDIVTPIIMHCKVSTPKEIEFRSNLGFKQHDIILTKEQSEIPKIMKAFSNE